MDASIWICSDAAAIEKNKMIVIDVSCRESETKYIK